jgi:hypothetical protein
MRAFASFASPCSTMSRSEPSRATPNYFQKDEGDVARSANCGWHWRSINAVLRSESSKDMMRRPRRFLPARLLSFRGGPLCPC